MWKSGGQPAISLESAAGESGLSPGTPEDFSAEKGRPAVLDGWRSELMETQSSFSSLQNRSPCKLSHFTHLATL